MEMTAVRFRSPAHSFDLYSPPNLTKGWYGTILLAFYILMILFMKIFSKLFFALVLVALIASVSPVYAQTTQTEICTVRATVTLEEAQKLAPGDQAITSGVSAGKILGPLNTLQTVDIKTNAYGILCAFAVVKQITDLLFLLVTILVVTVIVYSAYLFLTSGGDPKKITDARQWLLYAVIGIVVAIIARIIPGIAIALLGIG
jgi:hypothetical protein